MTQPAEPITGFQEVGDLLDRLADALRVVVRDYGPPWAPGSPAEADCARDAPLEGTPYLNAALIWSGCTSTTPRTTCAPPLGWPETPR